MVIALSYCITPALPTTGKSTINMTGTSNKTYSYVYDCDDYDAYGDLASIHQAKVVVVVAHV